MQHAPVHINRNALVSHPAERVFAVIEAAEHYPLFLPWCSAATILQRDDQVVVARIGVAWHGVSFHFVTRNPKRAPTWMSIGLVQGQQESQGPFHHFDGQWQLTPLADLGCRVDFALHYQMNSAVLGALAGPVFEQATNTLVDAFIQRADTVALGQGG